MQSAYKNAQAFLERHKAHIPALALIAGSIFDWLTLTGPDTVYANVMIGVNFLIAGGSLVLINTRSERERESLLLISVMQFCFGNLASGLFVLYSQSATLAGSWLFLLILGLFVFGNEMAKSRYERLRAQLISFHILLTAYLAILVPILIGKLGGLIFLFSCVIALIAVLLLGSLVAVLAPKRTRESWKESIAGFGVVLIVFSGLYYFNLIPPVPLSLKEIDIYQSVMRASADKAPAIYEARGESKPRWYLISQYLYPRQFHILPSGRAFCFSAVYAPVGLSAPIYHRYDRYDEASGKWVAGEKIPFAIRGGRAEGYRGYTLTDVAPGLWRCSVETQDGAVIGRTSFEVIESTSTPALMTEYK